VIDTPQFRGHSTRPACPFILSPRLTPTSPELEQQAGTASRPPRPRADGRQARRETHASSGPGSEALLRTTPLCSDRRRPCSLTAWLPQIAVRMARYCPDLTNSFPRRWAAG
jgi:hypothetical protein